MSYHSERRSYPNLHIEVIVLSENIKVAKTLDTKKMFCPMPIVKLSTAIKEIGVNDVLELLATDPGTLADVPNWVLSTGHELVKQSMDGNILKFYIKKKR